MIAMRCVRADLEEGRARHTTDLQIVPQLEFGLFRLWCLLLSILHPFIDSGSRRHSYLTSMDSAFTL